MSCKTKGGIIREKRKAVGLTQTELAKLCGVDPTLISAVELGKRVPTLPFLDKISSVLKFDDDCIGLSCDKDSDLGTILRHYRKKGNMSQQCVCDAVGLPLKMLNEIEHDERLISEKFLKRIVKKINVQNDKFIMEQINMAYEKTKLKFLSLYNGDIIKTQSIVLGLSNSNLAEELGISKRQLYAIRSGHNKLLLINLSSKIAKILKLDIGELWVYLNC